MDCNCVDIGDHDYSRHAVWQTMMKKRPEYVTREMLADLRDEIEHLLDQSNAAIDRAERQLSKRDNTRNDFRRVERRVEAMEKSVQDMLGLLGLASIPRHASVMSEQVSWHYFHSWVTRINERLDQIEKQIEKEHKHDDPKLP